MRDRKTLKEALKKASRPTERIAVPYDSILKQIHEHLEAVEQWDKPECGADYFVRAAKYAYMAESLIELLEIHNCGFVGGFDIHRGLEQKRMGRSLANRVLWLENVR